MILKSSIFKPVFNCLCIQLGANSSFPQEKRVFAFFHSITTYALVFNSLFEYYKIMDDLSYLVERRNFAS